MAQMPTPIATTAATAATARERGHGAASAAARLERDDDLRLGPRGGEDPVPKPWVRHRSRGGHCERLPGLPEGLELLLAALAPLEVLLEGAALVGIERVERVARGQRVNSGLHDPS